MKRNEFKATTSMKLYVMRQCLEHIEKAFGTKPLSMDLLVDYKWQQGLPCRGFQPVVITMSFWHRSTFKVSLSVNLNKGFSISVDNIYDEENDKMFLPKGDLILGLTFKEQDLWQDAEGAEGADAMVSNSAVAESECKNDCDFDKVKKK